jgi:phosphoglycerol transferase MdoB-like AlkP superfamily enzyme
MVAVSLLLFAKKHPGQAFAIFPVVLAMYVPISYYSDLWMYRRRQRNKAKPAEKA